MRVPGHRVGPAQGEELVVSVGGVGGEGSGVCLRFQVLSSK